MLKLGSAKITYIKIPRLQKWRKSLLYDGFGGEFKARTDSLQKHSNNSLNVIIMTDTSSPRKRATTTAT